MKQDFTDSLCSGRCRKLRSKACIGWKRDEVRGKNKSETLEKKANHLFLLHVLVFFFLLRVVKHTQLEGVGVMGCVKLPNSHERNIIWIGFINRIFPPSQMEKEGGKGLNTFKWNN